MLRRETAVAEEDSYVLELLKANYGRLGEAIKDGESKLDWFTLSAFLKK